MGDTPSRKLAVILHADVVGSTALVQLNETLAHERIQDTFRRFSETIRSHNGITHEIRGDALLAEFARASDAISASLAFQNANATHNGELPDDVRPVVRVGIAMGEVVVADNTITGEGVVLAQRLEQLAQPGGICIQDAAYQTIPKRLPFDYENLGERQVKGFDEPVRVYAVSLRPGAAIPEPETLAQGGDSAPKLPDKPAIAVLPFTNMSADSEQEYFSDGITEDIITELSRFKELSVVSRNSSFVFKGKAASLRDVGEKLKVDYVVEGSIRKAGNKVRVTAQLIDAKGDNHIWADRYDRDLEDIFEVQDDVVRRVASTLVGRLEHERQERTRRQSQSQLKAYDLYLRGRELFFNWTMEENLKARDLLNTAIEIEPEYAAALALSSEVLLRMWLNGWSESPERDLAESFDAAKRADEIDDQDSRVHTAMGQACIWQRDLDKAKHHFETALKLNPNDTRVLIYYSRQAVFDGHTEKGVELCHRALNLNPYGKYGYNLGIAYFVAHEYQRAVEFLDNVRNPPAQGLALLAANYAMAGDEAKAASTYARFSEGAKACPVISSLSQPQDWQKFFSDRWPFRKPEDLEHLLEALGKAGLSV